MMVVVDLHGERMGSGRCSGAMAAALTADRCLVRRRRRRRRRTMLHRRCVKDTPSHAAKLGDFEQPVLGSVKRYHLAN